jgi:hypothetical protein
MSAPIASVQECAAEAEFQLLCAKNHMDWLLALARAIQLTHTHGQAEVGEGLASLASYLKDTGFSATTEAIREFGDLAASPAPRNTAVPICGAEREGEQ